MRTGIILIVSLGLLCLASTPSFASEAIERKYQEMGGPTGPLGAPVTPEYINPDGVGQRQHYEWGSIYWSPVTGAYAIFNGPFWDKWAAHGWEQGLGYPVTDEIGNPDGVGRRQHYERGAIYWSPATGAAAILNGPFWEKWGELAWEQGILGYPIAEERPDWDRGGYLQSFERGFLYWTPTTGALVGSELFSWSNAGRQKGKHCTRMREPADPDKWKDNYLCSPIDWGLQWSYRGAIEGMSCTQVHEPKEPFSEGWRDNFLCAPWSLFLHFAWFHEGPPAPEMPDAVHCVRIFEPSEPQASIWQDNYLCYSDRAILE